MVIVTGSLAYDYIMDFPGDFRDHINPSKIHIINLSFLVDNLRKERGGTAGNIAYTLALLNEPVVVLACAGKDFAEYRNYLKKAGVDTSEIKIYEDEFSSRAYILTDLKNNQITTFSPGVMKFSKDLKLPKIKAKLMVIAPDDPEAMNKFVIECKTRKIPYMYDPGMQLPRLRDTYLRQGIKEAKILIGNDYEIGLIKNRLNFSEKDFLEFVEILIITLGEKGSIIKTKDKEYFIKPAKLEHIADPTGAGDAYRAGFLNGYLAGLDLQICGQMGSLTACYAIEKYGTTNHRFTLDEFKKRYKESFGKVLAI